MFIKRVSKLEIILSRYVFIFKYTAHGYPVDRYASAAVLAKQSQRSDIYVRILYGTSKPLAHPLTHQSSLYLKNDLV